MGRPEPGLVDGDRLLDLRQGLGEAPRPQQQIGELRQIARRLQAVVAVRPPVLLARAAQHRLAFVEALRGGIDGAERAQRFGRVRRIVRRQGDGAQGQSFGEAGVAAGEGDAREFGDRLSQGRVFRPEPRAQHVRRGSQQRFGVEVVAVEDVDLCQRDHRPRRVRRLAAIGGQRDRQRPAARRRRRGQRAVVELRAGKPLQQGQELRAACAAAALLDGERTAQPGDRPAIGRARGSRRGERAEKAQADGPPP